MSYTNETLYRFIPVMSDNDGNSIAFAGGTFIIRYFYDTLCHESIGVTGYARLVFPGQV